VFGQQRGTGSRGEIGDRRRLRGGGSVINRRGGGRVAGCRSSVIGSRNVGSTISRSSSTVISHAPSSGFIRCGNGIGCRLGLCSISLRLVSRCLGLGRHGSTGESAFNKALRWALGRPLGGAVCRIGRNRKRVVHGCRGVCQALGNL
jgi:hypothetical protein